MNSHRPRVVLVTGASSGIGLACATQLHQRGYRVFGANRQPRADAPFATLRMDVTDEQSVKGGIQAIVQQTGRLDAVINCAGFGYAGAVEDHSVAEAQEQLNTDFFGTFRVCRAALPVMREQHAGHIVNVGSIAGTISLPFVGLYSAAEFAMIGLTEALRLETRPFGIHAVTIRVGDACTGFTANRRHTLASRNGSVYSHQFRTMLSILEKDERSGIAPLKVAQLVEKIITSRTPRGVYTIGPIFEVFAATARPFVPARFFEWCVRKYYRLG
jgi:NAD(P)-dependent dehydrogenase (short-subunit alcohol dehydrogenase family)